MPLRVTRRASTGALTISGTVKGVRVQRRAGSDDPGLAEEEAATLEADMLRAAWHGSRPAVHTWPEAVNSYLAHAPRSPGTKALLRRLLLHFREAPLHSLNQEAVDRARAVLLRADAAPGTVRRNLIVPLRAVLLHAHRRDWCGPPKFDLPREPKGRTAFLMPDQAEALIAGAAPHLAPLAIFFFCTGARAREALTLAWSAVDLRAARAVFWEGETKSGRRRVVALPPRAVAALGALPHREGPVFRNHRGAPYRDSREGGYGGQIAKAWASACRRAGLPAEITPHVARHSFASWHYALHHDLLALKDAGGWSSVTLVERYAHLLPEGHETAIRRFWLLPAAGEAERRERA